MTSRRQNVLSVAVFLLVLIGILLLSPKNRERVQNGFLSLMSPFLKKGSEWDRSVAKLRHQLKTLQQLEVENDALKVENDKLKALNQALQGIEAENLRLKAAFGYKDQTPFSLVPARIIGRSESNWWSSVKIDRGTADGVQKDMSALTPDGLVGKVIAASDHISTVLLISDENCGVAATLRNPDGQLQHGIIRVVRGDRLSTMQQPRMTMSFLPKHLKVAPGWKVFTSGLGRVFPENVIVGEVVDIKPRELETEVSIQPAVNLAALTDVFIVTGLKGAGDK
ncbi:MAG: Cell shape-determining protein MreC precursor [Verrucomicrobiota bacterium]|jgi:rod shape-determining protein MreC